MGGGEEGEGRMNCNLKDFHDIGCWIWQLGIREMYDHPSVCSPGSLPRNIAKGFLMFVVTTGFLPISSLVLVLRLVVKIYSITTISAAPAWQNRSSDANDRNHRSQTKHHASMHPNAQLQIKAKDHIIITPLSPAEEASSLQPWLSCRMTSLR